MFGFQAAQRQVFDTEPLLPEAPVEGLQRNLCAGSRFDLANDVLARARFEFGRFEVADDSADRRGYHDDKESEGYEDVASTEKPQDYSSCVWPRAKRRLRDPKFPE